MGCHQEAQRPLPSDSLCKRVDFQEIDVAMLTPNARMLWSLCSRIILVSLPYIRGAHYASTLLMF
jgi:hypothetical protein